MEPAEVQSLYGGDYADRYEQIWQESASWSPEAWHHVRSLRELLEPGARWLDAGCGTGWNLSQFPGVDRAGLDLSPDMLAKARAANPDARFFQGDLRDDVPEWRDAWDLVSCTGQPWSYVATMEEIDQVVANLANWTAPEGRCFLPMSDLTDFTGLEPPYPAPGEPPWVDLAIVTGVFWSLHDAGGHHRHMVAPMAGYWIEAFSRHFRRIDIVRWPHEPSFLPVARRNLLASEKRRPGDDEPTEVVWHPIPPSSDDPPAPPPSGQSVPAPAPEPVVASEPEPSPEPVDAVPAGEVAPIPEDPSGRAVPPTDHAEPGLPPGRLPGRGLYDQPLSYLVTRFAPWKPAFWRSATRRARKLTR